MKGLLFLSRLALICNLCFLVTIVFQRVGDATWLEQGSKSIIIILGVLAFFVNLAVNIWYLWRVISRKPLLIASWLLFANILFLALEIFVQFILPS